MTRDQVECRSDHDYLGHPLAFYWQGKRYQVMDILVQNRTAYGYHFQVRTTDIELFELDYDSGTDEWSVRQP